MPEKFASQNYLMPQYVIINTNTIIYFKLDLHINFKNDDLPFEVFFPSL